MESEIQIQASPEIIPANDTLPTANFLARLTGIDKEYPFLIGKDVALWRGSLILSLTKVPVDTGPMPPGQSLVSGAYFSI